MEEIKRKLASIRHISDIKPIEGADNIELAIVDGWQCIVKKGEFKPNDICVYFEIDSFLPIRPEYEFLRKSSYKKMGDKEGFRLRTIKLRGQISQGLVLRLRDIIHYSSLMEFDEGDDLTEEFGIVKYEPPIPACLAGKVKGNFPSFIRKTDLERVQNIWNKVKDDDQIYEVTIKLDGTSCTFYLNKGEFGVCSRNMDLKEDENNVYWKMAKKYDVENILRKLGRNIALQGEIIGEGIQGNPEGIKGQEFYLFDIWDIDNHCYLNYMDRYDIYFEYLHKVKRFLNFEYKELMPRCPNPKEGFEFSLNQFVGNIDKLLKFADGPSLHAMMREGIVFKALESDMRFKVISNEYLLKEK